MTRQISFWRGNRFHDYRTAGDLIRSLKTMAFCYLPLKSVKVQRSRWKMKSLDEQMIFSRVVNFKERSTETEKFLGWGWLSRFTVPSLSNFTASARARYQTQMNIAFVISILSGSLVSHACFVNVSSHLWADSSSFLWKRVWSYYNRAVSESIINYIHATYDLGPKRLITPDTGQWVECCWGDEHDKQQVIIFRSSGLE